MKTFLLLLAVLLAGCATVNQPQDPRWVRMLAVSGYSEKCLAQVRHQTCAQFVLENMQLKQRIRESREFIADQPELVNIAKTLLGAINKDLTTLAPLPECWKENL